MQYSASLVVAAPLLYVRQQSLMRAVWAIMWCDQCREYTEVYVRYIYISRIRIILRVGVGGGRQRRRTLPKQCLRHYLINWISDRLPWIRDCADSRGSSKLHFREHYSQRRLYSEAMFDVLLQTLFKDNLFHSHKLWLFSSSLSFCYSGIKITIM